MPYITCDKYSYFNLSFLDMDMIITCGFMHRIMKMAFFRLLSFALIKNVGEWSYLLSMASLMLSCCG